MDDQDFKALQERVAKLEKGHECLADAIADNTSITAAIKGDTQELLTLFQTSKSGIKVIGWLFQAVKYIAAFTAACFAAYVAVKNFFNGA